MKVDRAGAFLLGGLFTAGLLIACSQNGEVRVVTATPGAGPSTQPATVTETPVLSALTAILRTVATVEATEDARPFGTVTGEEQNQNVFVDPRRNMDTYWTLRVGTRVLILGRLANQGNRQWVCVVGGPATGTVGEDFGREFGTIAGWMDWDQLEVEGVELTDLPEVEICAPPSQ